MRLVVAWTAMEGAGRESHGSSSDGLTRHIQDIEAVLRGAHARRARQLRELFLAGDDVPFERALEVLFPKSSTPVAKRNAFRDFKSAFQRASAGTARPLKLETRVTEEGEVLTLVETGAGPTPAVAEKDARSLRSLERDAARLASEQSGLPPPNAAYDPSLFTPPLAGITTIEFPSRPRAMSEERREAFKERFAALAAMDDRAAAGRAFESFFLQLIAASGLEAQEPIVPT